jgi:subtilisin-like proprotein convertase family protein
MKKSNYFTKFKEMKNYLQKFLKIFMFIFFAVAVLNVFATKNDIEKKLVDGTIACNDTVHIVMNWTCDTEVMPDQLLEGNYPDYGIFEVNIINNNGQSIGNTLSKEYVGQILIAEVFDTTTLNKCWSRISIKDQYAPILLCDNLYTTCFSDPLPGSFMPKNFRFAYDLNEAIPDNGALNLDLFVGNVPGAKITDFDIRLKIEHERNLDLEAYLLSPANDTVDLFDNLTCGNANFDVRFDDQATKTESDLSVECCACDPCIKGRFQPTGNLSDFNGEIPTGNWRLVVIDKNAGYTGFVTGVELLFQQSGAKVTFPIPAGASTPILIDNKTYEVTSGFDPCGSVELSYFDEVEDAECESGLTKIIHRNWRAVDESGNFSECTQLLYIINTGLSFLSFPPNFDNIEQPALNCNPQNPNFYPNPTVTGFPGTELCTGVKYSFEDQTDSYCSGAFKVVRLWRVSDLCSDEVVEHYQLIVIQDKQGPVLADMPDRVVSSNALDCFADVILDMPEVIAECSSLSDLVYNIGYQELDDSGAPVTDYLINTSLYKISNTRYVFRGAHGGSYLFTYTVTDDCGNSSIKTNKITVKDNVPPVAVCDQHTQVVLGVDGVAKVTALTFDDGSNDNCTDITFKVRRMTSTCELSDSLFRDTITFCCNDINTTQMVILKVTDANGLFNTCMVEAHVVDKIHPIIKCPGDITISCTDDFKNLKLTGTAQAFDNCKIDTLYYVDYININQCQIGTVKRNWVTKDNNNYQSSCQQIITIKDFGQFKPSDIIWPTDRTLTECNPRTDTASTGGIRFNNEDFCNMLSAIYIDEVYDIAPNSCKKILRKWEVIDWCNFNENDPNASTYRHTQVILIQNFKAPILSAHCQNRTFCSYGDCGGDIEYIKLATDDCTVENELNWTWRVDLDNNGTWDGSPKLTNNASGYYKNGIHRFAWIVEDGCGNETTCEELVTIKDCKKPTPLCITQLTTVVMNEVGMATICAKDFNLGQNCSNCNTGSYDNCTPKIDLKYSFSADLNDKCRTFTCADIPNGESAMITLDMWVTDNAGNQDFCTIYLEIQDNEADACPETTVGSLVYGFITDPGSKPMKGVKLNLIPNEGVHLFNLTGNNGNYIFNNINPEENYNIKPQLQTDYLLGVSTLDLVMIQKHILGVKTFDEAYKYIAADVNKSKSITASDILKIRKAILGETSNFGSDDNAWTFVSNDAALLNNPNILLEWKDNKDLSIQDYDKNINWLGVKFGDVNNSNNYAQSVGNLEPRSSEIVNLISENSDFNKGEEVELKMDLDKTEKISGAQFTLNFDSDILEYQSYKVNDALLDESNVGIKNVENGRIAVSWVKPQNAVKDSKNLLCIKFVAKSNGKLNENVKLSDDIARSEAYNSELEVMNVKLNFRNEMGYTLYQNVPNPFRNETSISFDMPNTGLATLEFIDITGKIVKKIEGNYLKGMNTVNVKFDDKISGVIYYRLQSSDFTETRKMLRLK